MRFDDEAVGYVQVFEPFDATIHGTFKPESKVHDEPKSGLGRLAGLTRPVMAGAQASADNIAQPNVRR